MEHGLRRSPPAAPRGAAPHLLSCWPLWEMLLGGRASMEVTEATAVLPGRLLMQVGRLRGGRVRHNQDFKVLVQA